MKIVVVGLGYVGLSNAVLLAQHHEVVGVDTSDTKVFALNNRQSPIEDKLLSNYLTKSDLNIRATSDLEPSLVNSDYVIIAVPTNYNEETKVFDTLTVEALILTILDVNPNTCIIIKSTVPIGFVDKLRTRHKTKKIIFSPEFLREGSALYDNLHPSRIIIGDKSQKARSFADIMDQCAIDDDINIVFTGPREAEAIKLFSNTYLAMRVAFFNELDSFSMHENLSSKEIIDGVSLDRRIGDQYNNPSFGYGGYCLPKDTKQLLANYNDVPENLISAIVKSNSTRKKVISEMIISKKPKVVGVYRLSMKSGSDNFRQSAILDVIEQLNYNNIEIMVYEPGIEHEKIFEHPVEKDIEKFKMRACVIITNRMDACLEDVVAKVVTRDIYGSDS